MDVPLTMPLYSAMGRLSTVEVVVTIMRSPSPGVRYA